VRAFKLVFRFRRRRRRLTSAVEVGNRRRDALEEVTVLQIEREHIEQLVARKPLLLRDIGRAITLAAAAE
jgi:hypothetical protein